jgi:effector-binding domain-containing protein
MTATVKMTEPKIEDRAEQHYMGIRVITPMSGLSQVIPQSLHEIFGWLGQRGIAPSYAPFVRYHVINMPSDLHIEMGVPVVTPQSGDERVKPGIIPAGQYAGLTYTGVANGIAGNAALLDWGEKQGLKWDTFDSPDGDGFVSRVEYAVTDPAVEPDMSKWETLVIIKLAD